MRSDLKSFNRIFPWQGYPARLEIQNLTALMLLVNLAGVSLFIYSWFFVRPYNLLVWYEQPKLTLRPFVQDDPSATWWLVWAFLIQGGLYWLGWRLALQLRGRAAWLIVLGGTLAFSSALLFLYPLDAADIFDNIMHGRILGIYQANPFREVAKQFAADPFYPYVAWRRTPSAYGPIWEILAGGVARLTGDGIVANVLAFKLLNGLFLALSIGLVALILRRVAPERALAGVVLLAWNPVVLYESIGNGHNDIVMAVWLLAAAWAMLNRRYTLAVLALLVGALIKFIPLLLLPLALVIALRHLPNLSARLRFLGITSLTAIALIVAAYSPFWYGLAGLGLDRRAELFTASLPAVIRAWLYLTWGVKDIGWIIGLVAAGLTGLFVLWQSRRAWANPSWLSFAEAGFNILIFYLLVTCLWFQQWYAIWPLVIAALLPPGHAPRLAVLFGFAAMSKHLIFGPLLFWVRPRPPRAELELIFGPAVLLLPWLYALLVLWLTRPTKSNHDPVEFS
ncbi:MAG: hypothetical protein HC875_18235 [Anaerolineales bacterium]|nr:hypothetical protein [Anaerolineales bacterium]